MPGGGGLLRVVTSEKALDTDAPQIEFSESSGTINSDLTVGVDVAGCFSLNANEGLSSRGMSLHGAGFIVTPQEAQHLGLGKRRGLQKHIREYRNGRDLTTQSRGFMVIDLFGLSADDVRLSFPEVYQHILATVKPERDTNNRETYRTNWWIFGEPRRELRPALAGQHRYIATAETAKHRIFQFLDSSILPDNKIVVVATEDASNLGILLSHIHVVWALRAGGWIGMGNDPVYIKSRCFDPFPFPDANNIQKQTIRVIAEELDAHRKRVLAEHEHLTLTGLYNVLEKLRAGAVPHTQSSPPGLTRGSTPSSKAKQKDVDGRILGRKAAPLPGHDEEVVLTETEQRIFDDGLVLIMKELHDKLDVAVAEAYRWPADLSDDEILAKLVALNKERAEEERRGLIRWLRPDYQIPRFAKGVDKQAASEDGAQVAAMLDVTEKVQKVSFPSGAVEQTAAVFAALAASNVPLDAKAIASQFRPSKTSERKITAVLASLARLGHVSMDGGKFILRRVA